MQICREHYVSHRNQGHGLNKQVSEECLHFHTHSLAVAGNILTRAGQLSVQSLFPLCEQHPRVFGSVMSFSGNLKRNFSFSMGQKSTGFVCVCLSAFVVC